MNIRKKGDEETGYGLYLQAVDSNVLHNEISKNKQPNITK